MTLFGPGKGLSNSGGGNSGGKPKLSSLVFGGGPKKKTLASRFSNMKGKSLESRFSKVKGKKLESYFANKPKGGQGNKPSVKDYNFHKHAKYVRIPGSKARFSKNISNIEWNRLRRKAMLGEEIKTNRGKDSISSREMRDKISEIAGKAGARGISGKRLRQKLIREMGLKYEDASKVVRAATYHYYEPPDEGPTQAEIQAHIKASRASAGIGGQANQLQHQRSDPKQARQQGQAKDIGAKTVEDINSTVAFQADKKGQAAASAASDKQQGEASVGAVEEKGYEHKDAVGIGERAQAKAQPDEDGKTKPKGGSQPVQLNAGVAAGPAEKPRKPEKHVYADDDLGIYDGGLIGSDGETVQGNGQSQGRHKMDFKSLIDQKKAAEGVIAADDYSEEDTEAGEEDYRKAA